MHFVGEAFMTITIMQTSFLLNFDSDIFRTETMISFSTFQLSNLIYCTHINTDSATVKIKTQCKICLKASTINKDQKSIKIIIKKKKRRKRRNKHQKAKADTTGFCHSDALP